MRGAIAAAVLLPLSALGASPCEDELAKVCGSSRGQGSTCAQCIRTHEADFQAAGCTSKDAKAFCQGPAPGPGPAPAPPGPKPPTPAPGPGPAPAPPGPKPPTPAPGPPGPPPAAGTTFPVADSITVEHTGRADLTETVHLDFSASCNITEAYFDYATDPTPYYYHIPASAKKAGLMIMFHGGGGDCHQLIDHIHSRITADRIMRLGLGVVFPSAVGGNYKPMMCKGPGEPDTSNVDLANVNKLVAGLTEKGLISAETPIATWGFSSGCSPTLDLRSCSAFRAQHKVAFAGGDLSRAWDVGPVDTVTRIPVYLHIGVHDSSNNKIATQEQAFRDLSAANVTAERCVPQPYPLTQDTLGGVCVWSAANRATMWQYLLANKFVDASGTVLKAHMGGLQDAINAAGVPGGMPDGTPGPVAMQLLDVLRMGDAGHAFALGCMEHEMAFLKAAMSA